MKTTTLRKIEKWRPSKDMWDVLLGALGKSEADDEPLPYSRILEICELHDAIWATRTEEDFEWVQELALSFGRHIQHLMADPRSVEVLEVAEFYLRGEASREEMKEALKDAYDAANTSPYTATTAAAYAAYAAVDAASSVSAYSSNYAANEAALTAHTASEAAYSSESSESDERAWQEAEFLRVVV